MLTVPTNLFRDPSWENLLKDQPDYKPPKTSSRKHRSSSVQRDPNAPSTRDKERAGSKHRHRHHTSSDKKISTSSNNSANPEPRLHKHNSDKTLEKNETKKKLETKLAPLLLPTESSHARGLQARLIEKEQNMKNYLSSSLDSNFLSSLDNYPKKKPTNGGFDPKIVVINEKNQCLKEYLNPSKESERKGAPSPPMNATMLAPPPIQEDEEFKSKPTPKSLAKHFQLGRTSLFRLEEAQIQQMKRIFSTPKSTPTNSPPTTGCLTPNSTAFEPAKKGLLTRLSKIEPSVSSLSVEVDNSNSPNNPRKSSSSRSGADSPSQLSDLALSPPEGGTRPRRKRSNTIQTPSSPTHSPGPSIFLNGMKSKEEPAKSSTKGPKSPPEDANQTNPILQSNTSSATKQNLPLPPKKIVASVESLKQTLSFGNELYDECKKIVQFFGFYGSNKQASEPDVTETVEFHFDCDKTMNCLMFLESLEAKIKAELKKIQSEMGLKKRLFKDKAIALNSHHGARIAKVFQEVLRIVPAQWKYSPVFVEELKRHCEKLNFYSEEDVIASKKQYQIWNATQQQLQQQILEAQQKKEENNANSTNAEAASGSVAGTASETAETKQEQTQQQQATISNVKTYNPMQKDLMVQLFGISYYLKSRITTLRKVNGIIKLFT